MESKMPKAIGASSGKLFLRIIKRFNGSDLSLQAKPRLGQASVVTCDIVRYIRKLSEKGHQKISFKNNPDLSKKKIVLIQTCVLYMCLCACAHIRRVLV